MRTRGQTYATLLLRDRVVTLENTACLLVVRTRTRGGDESTFDSRPL